MDIRIALTSCVAIWLLMWLIVLLDWCSCDHCWSDTWEYSFGAQTDVTTRFLIQSMCLIVVPVDVCDYSIADPCDAATQLMFRLIRLLDSCYIRRYIGAINKIPVILECTLVLSIKFMLYSNVLWCYQWDSCYTWMYFGAINKIPVVLECTLVLSMRFLLYSNVLWCYQCVILYEKAACKKLDISGNRFSIWKLLWQENSVPIN